MSIVQKKDEVKPASSQRNTDLTLPATNKTSSTQPKEEVSQQNISKPQETKPSSQKQSNPKQTVVSEEPSKPKVKTEDSQPAPQTKTQTNNTNSKLTSDESVKTSNSWASKDTIAKNQESQLSQELSQVPAVTKTPAIQNPKELAASIEYQSYNAANSNDTAFDSKNYYGEPPTIYISPNISKTGALSISNEDGSHTSVYRRALFRDVPARFELNDKNKTFKVSYYDPSVQSVIEHEYSNVKEKYTLNDGSILYEAKTNGGDSVNLVGKDGKFFELSTSDKGQSLSRLSAISESSDQVENDAKQKGYIKTFSKVLEPFLEREVVAQGVTYTTAAKELNVKNINEIYKDNPAKAALCYMMMNNGEVPHNIIIGMEKLAQIDFATASDSEIEEAFALYNERGLFYDQVKTAMKDGVDILKTTLSDNLDLDIQAVRDGTDLNAVKLFNGNMYDLSTDDGAKAYKDSYINYVSKQAELVSNRPDEINITAQSDLTQISTFSAWHRDGGLLGWTKLKQDRERSDIDNVFANNEAANSERHNKVSEYSQAQFSNREDILNNTINFADNGKTFEALQNNDKVLTDFEELIKIDTHSKILGSALNGVEPGQYSAIVARNVSVAIKYALNSNNIDPASSEGQQLVKELTEYYIVSSQLANANTADMYADGIGDSSFAGIRRVGENYLSGSGDAMFSFAGIYDLDGNPLVASASDIRTLVNQQLSIETDPNAQIIDPVITGTQKAVFGAYSKAITDQDGKVGITFGNQILTSTDLISGKTINGTYYPPGQVVIQSIVEAIDQNPEPYQFQLQNGQTVAELIGESSKNISQNAQSMSDFAQAKAADMLLELTTCNNFGNIGNGNMKNFLTLPPTDTSYGSCIAMSYNIGRDLQDSTKNANPSAVEKVLSQSSGKRYDSSQPVVFSNIGKIATYQLAMGGNFEQSDEYKTLSQGGDNSPLTKAGLTKENLQSIQDIQSNVLGDIQTTISKYATDNPQLKHLLANKDAMSYVKITLGAEALRAAFTTDDSGLSFKSDGLELYQKTLKSYLNSPQKFLDLAQDAIDSSVISTQIVKATTSNFVTTKVYNPNDKTQAPQETSKLALNYIMFYSTNAAQTLNSAIMNEQNRQNGVTDANLVKEINYRSNLLKANPNTLEGLDAAKVILGNNLLLGNLHPRVSQYFQSYLDRLGGSPNDEWTYHIPKVNKGDDKNKLYTFNQLLSSNTLNMLGRKSDMLSASKSVGAISNRDGNTLVTDSNTTNYANLKQASLINKQAAVQKIIASARRAEKEKISQVQEVQSVLNKSQNDRKQTK